MAGYFVIVCTVFQLFVQCYAIKEGAPGAPTVLRTEANGPTSVTFTILPYEDKNKVLSYDVDYSDSMPHHLEFKPAPSLTLENLYPMTQYAFRLTARNDYGAGPAKTVFYTTGHLDTPSEVQVVSSPSQKFAHEYILVWEKPRDGGLEIRKYTIKLRPVQLVDNKVTDALGEWKVINVDAASVRKTNSYTLKDLEARTSYELVITAHNDMGQSSFKGFTFTTAA